MATEQELAPVTASLVAESDRLSFLPEVIGPHFMRFEALVYRWLSNLSQDYNGGFWNYSHYINIPDTFKTKSMASCLNSYKAFKS